MNAFEKFLNNIKLGNLEKAQFYFDENFLNKEDEFGFKPIHWACFNHHEPILKWILEEKCDVNLCGRYGWRPIHCATLTGNKETVKLLIENYCDVDCKTDNNETPLDIAIGQWNHDFIDQIFRKNINSEIGSLMGLKCGPYCEHNCCLISISNCNFKISEKIGRGTFGKIYKIVECQNNRIFACKKIKVDKFTKNELNNIIPFINEYRQMISHEKIINYYGGIEKSEKLRIFMEHMSGGSLENVIKSNVSLSEMDITRYTKDILQALAFLHQNQIVHRRVKPSHMLLDHKNECKITISTFSRLLVHQNIKEKMKLTKILPGTLNFMAPEIINEEPYSFPVDIWSMGCSLINILTGFPPYHDLSEYDVCFKVGTNKIIEYPINKPIFDNMRIFINKMLTHNDGERPTAEDLLKYAFLQNVPIDYKIDCPDNMISPEIFNFDEINRENQKIFNRENRIDLIRYATDNKKIGLAMGLKCEKKCDHKFCLSSATATNFEKGVKIGQGAFGSVYIIKESKSNRVFAMKVVNGVTDKCIKKKSKCFEGDINLYRDSIKHDRIVRYFGSMRNSTKIFIFMEFINGGSLSNKIEENNYEPLPEKIIKLYTRQILEGLKFLHDSKITHRDIKSQNILLSKEGNIKIADFGLSRFLRTISEDQRSSLCGTVNYMSPEMITEDYYNCSTDIWSVGATVLEMALGRPPYYGMGTFAVMYKIGNEKKLEYPLNISVEMREFLDLMINGDPTKRANAESLLCCDFLAYGID